MNIEIIITFGVLLAVLYALLRMRAAADMALMGGLTLLLIAGVVDLESAMKGFANEGLITVAVLFVVAEGLRQTGAITFIGQDLLGQPATLKSAQSRIMFPVAIMSAFMNNTPVVAMMMPMISDWAKKNRFSVSHLLMPLSYAAILGGMCTLYGTSTTLVVNGLLKNVQEERAARIIEESAAEDVVGVEKEVDSGKRGSYGISLFELAWVGLPASVAGLLFLLFFAHVLIPERISAMTQFDDPREYSVEMLVNPGSQMIGKTIEQAGLRHLPGMYLMEIDRDDQILAAVASDTRIKENDRLVFVGIVESIVDLQKMNGLTPATDQVFKVDSPRSERVLIEAVVSNRCPFVNMTIRESRFRSQYNAAVIAVSRNGQRIRKKIGDIKLISGDTLLVEAHPAFIERQRNSRDFFLVSQVEDSSPLRYELAWIARAIFALMIILVVGFHWEMLEASLLAAGLMIVTRCLRGAEARRSVDWSILVTIGAGLGIGKAIEQSGADDFIVNNLLQITGQNPTLMLALICGITMFFTNLITAKAAAGLFFPIAVAASVALDVDLMPFVIGVMIAAASSFATPIGYQTNLMVFGPGGYRYSDFLRVGGPLSIIVWIITVIITPIIWPF
jgi:di/tricarboxylate transporter